MTKSQRRTNAQYAQNKVKKTKYLCEECDSKVVKMGKIYVCGTCGLTQYKYKLIEKHKSQNQVNADEKTLKS